MTEVVNRSAGLATNPAYVAPSWRITAITAPLMAVGLGAALWTAGHVNPDAALHDCALFVHLASMVIGLGAVLAVDWVALLWVLQQRHLSDVLRTAQNAHIPIWAGYAGLVGSGVLLEPDLSNPITQAKLGLVLLIGWNGLIASFLLGRITRVDVARPERNFMVVSGFSATVSQVGWWGAMVIGFLNGR